MDLKKFPYKSRWDVSLELLGLLVLVIIIVLLSIFFIQYASDWSYVTGNLV